MEDDFADMPLLEDASDHDNSPAVMQAKGSESHSVMTLIDDHVEIYTHVVVPSSLHPTSPRRAKSPADSKVPINTQIDGHHLEVSAIVIVPSLSPHTSHRKAKSLGDVKALSLVLQNHFSSFDGLETINVVSKFWVDPNEMEEDVNDTGEEIVCTKRKPG